MTPIWCTCAIFRLQHLLGNLQSFVGIVYVKSWVKIGVVKARDHVSACQFDGFFGLCASWNDQRLPAHKSGNLADDSMPLRGRSWKFYSAIFRAGDAFDQSKSVAAL